MAAKSQNSKVYPLPIQCFVLELRSSPIREFMNIKWVAEDVMPNNALHYQYQHGVTMTSWGETIDIWLTALGERATQVDIRSECYLPTQIIDWGKNHENVMNLFTYLDNCVNLYLINNGQDAPIPHVEMPTAPQPTPPVQYQQPAQAQYQPPVQQPVCPGCGTPVTPGAKFCSNCGTRLM